MVNSAEIDYNNAILDSYEIEERITYLEYWYDERDPDLLTNEERDELEALVSLRDRVQAVSDKWDEGVDLIQDRYIKEYPAQFADNAPEHKVTFNGTIYWV